MSADAAELAGLAPRVLPAPTNLREYLSVMGLCEPSARALVASAVVTGGALLVKRPRFFFTEQGSLKKFALDPDPEDDDEATVQLHFPVVPLATFAFVYFFL